MNLTGDHMPKPTLLWPTLETAAILNAYVLLDQTIRSWISSPAKQWKRHDNKFISILLTLGLHVTTLSNIVSTLKLRPCAEPAKLFKVTGGGGRTRWHDADAPVIEKQMAKRWLMKRLVAVSAVCRGTELQKLSDFPQVRYRFSSLVQ